MSKATDAKVNKLTKTFRRARVRIPSGTPIKLQPPAEFLVNDRLGPRGHQAVEEIRQALILISSPSFATMRFGATGGGGDWTQSQKDVYERFRRWDAEMGKVPKCRISRDCAILFAKGERPTRIERIVRIKNGTARKRILQAVQEYCRMAGWKRTTKQC